MNRPRPVEIVFATLRPSVVAILGAVLLLGCPGGVSGPQREPGSALWIGPVAPSAEDLERLREAEIGELFLPALRLDLGHSELLKKRSLPDIEPATRVTVVIDGEVDFGSLDAGDLGRQLAAAGQQSRFDLESRGLRVIGLHLDLTTRPPFEKYASLLEILRGELDERLFLSISVERGWLDQAESLRPLVERVSFVTPFLYGQLPREAEDTSAWDFEVIGRRLSALEELEVPYLVGVVALGTATHVERRGRIAARTTRQSVAPFLWNPQLELRTGFSLEAAERRIYNVVAQQPVSAGGWQLAPGDGVRLEMVATADLEELLGVLGSGDYPHHRGQLYYRLPAPEEQLSLGLDQFIEAHDARPATPELRFEVLPQRRTPRGWLLRFAIENVNGEMSELSLLDSNFLEVTTEPGAFGSEEVDVGDFYRYDLLRRTSDGGLERTFRNPGVLRLFVPILAGKGRLISGDIEIRRRNPELELRGTFLLPDGRSLELGPFMWRDGSFVDQADEAVPSDP